jgi:hypothetical protein
MSALKTARRVTVYADAALESALIEVAMSLGSKGHSASPCRGKGKHDLPGDARTDCALVRLEFLVKPEVGEKIMQHLSQPQYWRRAVAACMEEVSVLESDDF